MCDSCHTAPVRPARYTLQCQRWQQQRWTIRFTGQKDRQFMFSFWLKVAVAFYGIASLAVVPAVLYDRPQWRRIALPTATLGVFFHFVSLVERMQFAHHTLPVNRQEVESVMGLLLVTGFLLVAGRYRTLTLGMVTRCLLLTNGTYCQKISKPSSKTI